MMYKDFTAKNDGMEVSQNQIVYLSSQIEAQEQDWEIEWGEAKCPNNKLSSHYVGVETKQI